MAAPFFPGAGRLEGDGVSAGLGDGVSVAAGDSLGVGVGDIFFLFDLLFGVGVGDGVGEAFLFFGEVTGDGLGVALFDERFRCLRAGLGVGVAKIFLIFVPNDSSAASAAQIAPNNIATIRSHFIIGTVRLRL